ncbi:MAG: hypothetical protein QOH61_1169 [Chloroflexota bacterium]|jgi:hypothetical protein|nr:hypothetical protein [Chloroflexota bacterium]
MGTIVVVHGAGVRSAGIDRLEQSIRNGIRDQPELRNLKVVMCRWGEVVGAIPVGVDDTLPPTIVTRALAAQPDDEALEAARWSLLFDDPLFELRIIAAGGPGTGVGGVGPAIGGLLPSQAAHDVVAALASQQDLPTAATGIGPKEFSDAIGAVAASSELGDAATVVGSVSDVDLAPVVARAIVAEIIAGHRADAPGTMPALVINGTIRDAFVALLAERLAPVTTKGLVPGWIRDRIGSFIAHRATALAADHRIAIQDENSLVLADILHYLRRGAAMVDHVTKCLAGADGPVLALGHSLGGIMLVDLLARASHPPVDLLVTVGSQASILYAYDALERPRADATSGATKQPAPAGGVNQSYSIVNAPFTPWLNIYNRNDFVSFRAKTIFERELGHANLDIVDEELHLPEAFPAAHSAYWTDNWTFRFIADRVAAVPAFQP